jgi:hypothetical protein
MNVLRLLSLLLPQLLVLLLIGGSFDLLGGWNKTDEAFSLLAILFLFNPLITGGFLVITMMRRRREAYPRADLSLASVMLAESLLTNLFILSQVRMH